MTNFEGSPQVMNLGFNGKHSLLPPKSPFPSVPTSFADHASGSATGSISLQMHRDGPQHQRTSSESVVIEDQPSWLDELLDEPETPVRRGGHRRSASDSFAYLDTGVASSNNLAAWDDHKFKNLMAISSWGTQPQDVYRDAGHVSFHGGNNLSVRHRNNSWGSNLNMVAQPSSGNLPVDRTLSQNSGVITRDTDRLQSTVNGKQDTRETIKNDKKGNDGNESFGPKAPASEADTKRAKQQFAQRSRVRKLQYIAELERSMHALQVEGSEFLAELEFTNQQHLILSLENKALKQQLHSLAQEHLIKYMEQEVLEREIGRLRNMHQQQMRPPSNHRRNDSRELDSQFANLSLNKEASPNKAVI